MSDETVYNLLRGTSAQAQTSTGYVAFKFALTKALEVGKTYTFSVDVDELSSSATDSPYIGPNDGNGNVRYCTLRGTGHKVGTFTVGNLNHDESVYDFASFAIYNTPGLAGSRSATKRLVIRNAMLVEGDTPAAWAPAEGEEIAGGGVSMSANLLDGVSPTLDKTCSTSNGVITSAASTNIWYDVAIWPLSLAAVSENQTLHLGASVRWHGDAATAGHAYMAIRYADAAGNTNAIDLEMKGITAEWQRFSLPCVLPSGMRVTDFHVSSDMLDAPYDLTAPCLSYGGPVTLSIASTTVAWSASIVATVRYWQLAAPTAATPAVPASASALGSWSETEPDVDTSKVLWHCERTVYSDGTESWSKASKSTSYEAAKKNASDIAQLPTKTDVSTSIRKESESINATIKSATTVDGKTVAEQINSINQTIDGTTQTFERHQSELDDLKGTLDDLTASISTYMDESGRPVIEMGASSSNLKTRLTNDALEFISDGRFVAGASGDRFRAPMVDADDIRIGGYAVTESTDGSVSIDWNGV